MKNLAPIALFAYNRPKHTRKTIQALQNNDLSDKSDLFIFCDGPKNDVDILKIQKVYQVIDNISGFKSVNIEKSQTNKGLANSIIYGVSKIVNQFGKVIVLEDDLIVSPYFLKFMNDGLEFYQNQDQIISIHGYVYPTPKTLPETFFLKGADCWGWATWKRGWDLFNPDGKYLLEQLKAKNLTKEFDFNKSYPYTRMLEDWVDGKNNSWAIRWYASAFLANKLTLYPGKSLVKNIGNDGSGTHCADVNLFDTNLYQKAIPIKTIDIAEDIKSKKIIASFFRPKTNFFKKIITKINKKVAKFRKKKEERKYGWFQTTLSWQEANKICAGYDNQIILEKCKQSLLAVKNGNAVYERDSVLFNKTQYSWPVLSSLMWIASQNDGQLSLIDFGGSLGSSFFQNKKFLSGLKKVTWNIVEQSHFVKCGKEHFESDKLKFYHNIDEYLKTENSDTILFSSVLQYLEFPYDFLEKILEYNFKYLIIDLTGFTKSGNDILTIQKVPPQIYNASYPCWFFSKTKLFSLILKKYDLVEEFDSYLGQIIKIDNKPIAGYKGAIFKLKNNA